MANEEILKKAIEKAVREGWSAFGMTGAVGFTPEAVYINYMEKEIIFNHDFAKAFFGEKDYWKETKCTCGGVDFHLSGSFDTHKENCAKVRAARGYKFHLGKMVVEEEPLKYLEKFL